MSRAAQLFTNLSVATTAYLGLMFVDLPESLHTILAVLPWWALVTFGSYSLWTLGWAMLSFRECPQAYAELTKEVDEAKHDLLSKGVDVD
ncbi:dolichol-phosphate mannosyltransferase subunit 3 [Auriculariales sp. MPI-PUGE-AT-0066]|nr:dolichol-phosphate mannosyltransferase subunit 3 [Auriculariales sp. MPI-PUGE-AT-0066]